MISGVEAKRIAYSIATSQEGVISRRQLMAQEVSEDVLRHWIRTGYLFRFLPGVYSLGRPGEAEESFWMAGVLYSGDSSLLSGKAAARFWGIENNPSQVDAVRPYGTRKLVQGLAPHQDSSFLIRRASIGPDDFHWKRSLPVMDPARALIDLCTFSNERQMRRYFIEAGRNGLLTASCLNRMNQRSLRFKNRKTLTKYILLWDPTTGRIRSVLEGEFTLLCAEGKVRSPLTNYPIGRYEVDAVWLEERVVVELDGRKFHSDATALIDDSEKTRNLRSLGFTVLRFTWNDVIERPDWVLARVRAALGSIHRDIAPVF